MNGHIYIYIISMWLLLVLVYIYILVCSIISISIYIYILVCGGLFWAMLKY